MPVTVRFYGVYREKVGAKETSVDVDGELTLRELLESLRGIGKRILQDFSTRNIAHLHQWKERQAGWGP